MRTGMFFQLHRNQVAQELSVDASQRVRGLNDSQRARRTFAATATHDRALLGVCPEVSLADLATILATTRIAGDSRIERAMNLDGGSSSAFWFARENGSAFSIPAQKPVRDFVAVAPKEIFGQALRPARF